ncbi:MAG: exo-alpha-sialidase [Pelatocladus maniniholoensis HA4357-MV3]|jgi:RNA binding exosome subunit|uniref:Exo-alpha-sialidase n=1 Tax=Pelatocladus maniniholoensis HA4357-MV3 TaxID=1117104 RepID=A0A9E3H7E5_9NOST|nr:exo-alpha-sialidase [Pelatocladus maniniholoensis HA4357-MV3]BAZ66701.1 hypothetical protein NIES4106_14530 [Fischerella sp. NIES-4106]
MKIKNTLVFVSLLLLLSPYHPAFSSTKNHKYSLDKTKQSQNNTNVVTGGITNLQSSSQRMISYRHQERMWFTEDGGMHLIINEGNNSTNSSLVLYSSFDYGATWKAMSTISETNEESTPDGFLYNSNLFLTYSSSTGKIYFSILRYDVTNKTWQPIRTNIVYEDANYIASNATIAVDKNNRFWIAFIRQNVTTNEFEIKTSHSTTNGASWEDTGLTLGTVSSSRAKSAKLVRLSDRMGVVYTNEDTINWAYRMNDWSLTTPWSEQLLFQHQPGSDRDPYASHFNVVVDQLENIHVPTRDQGQLLYLRFDRQNQSWDTPRILTDDSSVAYVQATVSGDNRLLISYNQQTFVKVLQSSDYGKTFPTSTLLAHPKQESLNTSADFTRPRIEAPTRVGSWLPVLQQFVMDGKQKLLYYNLKLDTPSQALNNNIPTETLKLSREPVVPN